MLPDKAHTWSHSDTARHIAYGRVDFRLWGVALKILIKIQRQNNMPSYLRCTLMGFRYTLFNNMVCEHDSDTLRLGHMYIYTCGILERTIFSSDTHVAPQAHRNAPVAQN